MKSKRKTLKSIWLLSLFYFILLIPLLSIVEGFWEDCYIYMELAENLEQFHYESYRQPHYKYLPGYPIGIAAIHLLSVKTISFMLAGKLVSLISHCMVFPITFILVLQLGFSRRAAWYAVIIILLNPYAINMSTMVYTESFVALLTTFSILQILKQNDIKAGIVSACAAWVRPEALFLVFCRFAVNRNLKRLFRYGVSFFIVLSPLILRQLVYWLNKSDGYLQEVTISRHSGLNFLSSIPEVLGLFSLVMVCAGLMNGKLRRAWVLHIFLVGYILLHMWWWWTENRYIVAILPILSVYIGEGLNRVHEFLSKKSLWPKLYRTLWIVFLVIIFAGRLLPIGGALFMEECTRSEFFISTIRMLDQSRFKPGGLITSDPGMVRYHSKRFPIATWDHQDLDTQEYLYYTTKHMGARYIVLPYYYVFDFRFPIVLEKQIQQFDFLVRPLPGDQEEIKQGIPYRLTIKLLFNRSGSRIRYIPRKPWEINFRLFEPESLTVDVFELHLHRITLKPGDSFNAVLIDEKELFTRLGY